MYIRVNGTEVVPQSSCEDKVSIETSIGSIGILSRRYTHQNSLAEMGLCNHIVDLHGLSILP